MCSDALVNDKLTLGVMKVPLILAHLMSDRRIARAAHPIINAWRCRVGNNLHQGKLCVDI